MIYGIGSPINAKLLVAHVLKDLVLQMIEKGTQRVSIQQYLERSTGAMSKDANRGEKPGHVWTISGVTSNESIKIS
jgi:hypothetical protein